MQSGVKNEKFHLNTAFADKNVITECYKIININNKGFFWGSFSGL